MAANPRKKRAGVCTTKRCRNTAAPGRAGRCYTCASRAWRAANPMRAAYNNLKAHAKWRGHDFDLSFPEFSAFCISVGYLDKKGIARDSYHIDRKDESKGYTFDNLQCITNEENARKSIQYRRAFIRDMHGHGWQKTALTPCN